MFRSDGSSKTLQKTFYKKIVWKSFYPIFFDFCCGPTSNGISEASPLWDQVEASSRFKQVSSTALAKKLLEKLLLRRCAFATHKKTRPGWVVPEEQPTETSDQGGWANTAPLPFAPPEERRLEPGAPSKPAKREGHKAGPQSRAAKGKPAWLLKAIETLRWTPALANSCCCFFFFLLLLRLLLFESN
jgi:hypothetical protein